MSDNDEKKIISEEIDTEDDTMLDDFDYDAQDVADNEPNSECKICGNLFYVSDDLDNAYVCPDCQFAEDDGALPIFIPQRKSKNDKGQFGMVKDREQFYDQKPNYRPLRSERGEDD